ncbi:decaprenyl-phosphate phosphoribosyltransferase [Thermomicrobiaceae bacterium CFH 74404]|uniref:Decaprenyl-phosphate phosphoribosyltransferase n=1 Tax=Thermalbibacter longus TaxID=2951981 RepID=A0AA42B9X7_9BACT|nr:decaprenyl-phosphate phosphoribosyltransferase [Thermalbibacter longus]MCM8749191.1 decaprenyl-phosphate phosphoribosyltransferase [Thermalbibacter longus]
MADLERSRVLSLEATAARWVDLLVSLRPRQWIKNAVVFAPLVFGGLLTDWHALLRATVAMLAFCAAGSALYLFNDWHDAEADRQHPLKRYRPIAAGRIGASTVRLSIGILLVVAVVSSVLIGPKLLAVLGAYVMLIGLYTLVLKHLVLIDVLAIAGGFVLRAVAGAVAVQVPLSPWLYVCTVLLALFLGFAKRRHEMVLLEQQAANHRRNLDDYTVPLLDALLTVTAAATLMAYSLYTFSAPNLPDNHAMMMTIPFVIYGMFRYLYLVYRREQGGVPEQVLLTDLPLLTAIGLWGLTAIILLYGWKLL